MNETTPTKRIVSLDSQWFNGIQNCPRKLKYQLLDSLRPKHNPEPLDRGDVVHQIMDAYYTGRMQGLKHAENLQQALIKGELHAAKTDLDQESIRESIEAAKGSLNHHQSDGWIPLAVEQAFSYVFYDSPELQIVSTGVIDLIVDIPGVGPTVVDHKSSKRSSTPFPLSNQFMNYCNGSGTTRAIVNKVGMQKTVPAEQKFGRVMLSYHQAQLDEFVRNTVFWVKFGLQCIDNDYFPMNLTACDKYAGCIFVPICGSHPDTRDWKINISFIKGKQWDPYTKGK